MDWAVQNGCGTIQIEDLTGYASENIEQYKLLKNWSYYDLQTKIECKAKEYGIDVIKVGYSDLKKWCPDCNKLTVKKEKTDDNNEKFVCGECGQIFNLDYIVETAVAVPDICRMVKEK